MVTGEAWRECEMGRRAVATMVVSRRERKRPRERLEDVSIR
jgi:hypothetical protein